MSRLSCSWVIGFLVAFVVSGCATTARTPEPSQKDSRQVLREGEGVSLTGQENAEYQDIQASYSRGNHDVTLQKIMNFEKKYPRSGQMPLIRNLHGLIYLFKKKPLYAVAQFKRAAELSQNETFKQYILYNLGAAQIDAAQILEAQQTFASIEPQFLDRETLIKYYSMRARVFQKLELPDQAAREVLSLSRLLDSGTDPSARTLFTSQLDAALQSVKDLAVLQNLYRDFEDSPFADKLLLKLGSMESRAGQSSAAETHLRALTSRFPQSPHYAEAAELLKALETQSVVDPKAVGVLLPMNGKFGKFGAKALQAIELAFKIFGSSGTEGESGITLYIEDSGEDPEQALRGLETLYFKHHVVAVIGPLSSRGIDQVSARAQELGLPMITLSQQPGGIGDFVASSAMTPKVQAEELARHAVEDLKLRKFAILHPRDKFGEQYSQAFWDAVESLGGEIVGDEAYAPGETDFKQAVDKLSGLHYVDARQREIDALAEERKKQDVKKKTLKNDALFHLPPVVDYEAVFIPDEPKVVGQILPMFAYRDVEHVQFLGPSTWNSPELLSRAAKAAEGAFFVDAFYPNSSLTSVRRFVSNYKTAFGQDPGAIEAQSFDAARILDHILVTERASTRSDVRDAFKKVDKFQGVTGKISYRDGQFSRGASLLTVKTGQIVEKR